MKRIRLVFAINNLNVGGGQRYLVDVLNHLDRTRFDVRTVSLGEGHAYGGELHDEIIELGAEKSTRDVSMLAPFVRLLMDFQPDILHTHLRFADTIGQLLGSVCCVPAIVSTIHNTVEWPRDRRTLVNMVEDFAVARADRIIAVSQRVADFVIEHRGVRPERTHVMPCGIDVSRFVEARASRENTRAELGLSDDTVAFACVGQFRPEKRHDLLVDRFKSLLSSSGIPLRLLLIGVGGVNEQRVHEQVRDLALQEQVQFLGGARDDVARWLGASDVYVMHSEFEGASLAVVEAMACGLPVLLPRMDHFTMQAADHVHGLLFGFDDPGEFVACAMALASDGALRTALGKAAARHAVDSFGIESHLRRVEALYHELVAHRASPMRTA